MKKYFYPTFDESQEIWKDLPGFEGSYQVSNMGRAKSVERMADTNAFGVGSYKVNEKFLKFDIIKGDYLRFTASLRGKTKRFIIHRVVAQLYISNPDNKEFVNHLKGNKWDNRAS